MQVTLRLETKADAVFGQISLSEDAEEFYTLDHIHLIGNKMKFTFDVGGKRNKLLEVKAFVMVLKIIMEFIFFRRIVRNN